MDGDVLTPATIAAIERMVGELATRGDHGDLAHRLEALIELLVMSGQLTEGHRAWLASLQGERTQVKLTVGDDKRAIAGPDIDCASLLHLCKGRCCSLTVTLSREDLLEGRLRWDLHDPYVLVKDDVTGYCANLQHDGCCAVYADRPITCRVYDCRRDPRVWIDYDARVPAPMPARVIPFGEWPAP